MKRQIKSIAYALCALLAAGCSESSGGSGITPDEPVAVDGIFLSIGNSELAKSVKAITDYSVNGSDDPTASLVGRETWELHAVIYSSSTYGDGEATFTFDSGNKWVTPQNIYFPNYLTQNVSAELYPVGFSDIEADQSTFDKLLLQDILEQDGDSTTAVRPAHIPEIPMRHAHSMIDFILKDVDISQISDLAVLVGATEYQPYKVNITDKEEYLVILPLGTSRPVVRIRTNEGAEYRQAIDVDSTLVNTCYCVTLEGLELRLSTITVTNWAYGEATAGAYSSTASYPTFRAYPDISLTLGYNNKVTQELTFNARGEITVKPRGHTVEWIYFQDTIYLDPPLVLRDMIIDLTKYVDEP